MERDPHQLIEGVLHRLLRHRRRARRSSTSGARWPSPRSASPRPSTRPTPPATSASNILGTDFSVDVVLHWGAGAYIVGEETALIESLEGNRGMPRLKPPFFPAAKGLYMQPTIVNNVETLSNLPVDRRQRRRGLRRPRRRELAGHAHVRGVRPRPEPRRVRGRVRRHHLPRPHLRARLRRRHPRRQPAQGVHPRRRARRPWFFEEHLDLPLEKGTVDQAGSMLGSGAIVVMDETTDAVKAVPARRAVLRPRVLRQVHAVPRGHHLARADPAAHPRRPRPPERPRAAARRLRQHQPRHRLAAQADHDLPARPVGHRRRSPRPSCRFRDEFEAYIGGTAESTVAVSGSASPSSPPGRRPMPEHRGPARRRRRPSRSTAPRSSPARASCVIDAAERNGIYIPRFCYHPRMRAGRHVPHVHRRGRHRPRPGAPARLHDRVHARHEGRHRVARSPRRPRTASSSSCSSTTRSTARSATRAASARCRTRPWPTGPGESRFVEEKRHYEKPIPISDLVLLDRERCILCDRCTRFAKEVAGDPLIHFQRPRQPDTEVNTFPDQPFAVVLQRQHRADLPGGRAHRVALPLQGPPVGPRARSSPPAPPCSVGCRISVQSSPQRGPALPRRRHRPGQLGLALRQGPLRLRGREQPTTASASRSCAHGDGLAEPPAGPRPSSRGAPTRPPRRRRRRVDRRASVAPASPTRTPTPGPSWPRACIGTDNVDAQLGDGLPAEVVLGLPRATIDEVCAPGGTVLLLGPDLKEELPVLFLRLRHAVVNDGVTVVEVSPRSTRCSRRWPRHRCTTAPARPARSVARSSPARPTRRGRRRRAAPPRPRRAPLLAAAGPGHRRARPAELAESRRRRRRRRGCAARRPARRPVPPGPAPRPTCTAPSTWASPPGCCPAGSRLDAGPRLVRRRAGRPCPPPRGLDTTGILQAAADGTHRRARAARRRPAGRLPRPRPGRAGPRRRPHRHRRRPRSSTPRRARPTSCCRPPASPRSTAPPPTSRAGSARSPSKVTPPGTARADWMIAAELALPPGRRPRLSSRRADLAEIEPRRPVAPRLTVELRSTPAADGVVVPLPPRPSRRPPTPRPTPPPRPRPPTPRPTPMRDAADEADAGSRGRARRRARRRRHRQPVRLRCRAPTRSPAARRLRLRLVATRKLYDQGTLRAALARRSPASRPAPSLRVNPLRLRPPRRRRRATQVRGRRLGPRHGRRLVPQPVPTPGRAARDSSPSMVVNQPERPVGGLDALVDASDAPSPTSRAASEPEAT